MDSVIVLGALKRLIDAMQSDVDDIKAKTLTLPEFPADDKYNIIGTGSFTTDSASLPADTSQATKATNFYNGCLLIPLNGVCAFQPRPIMTFTTGTGVFTLLTGNPFTAMPGLVAYVIMSDSAIHYAPTANLATAITLAQTVGNKADALSNTEGTASVVALCRYIINAILSVQGGADTITSIGDKFDSFINLLRSGWSTTYTPTVGVGETKIYENTPTIGIVEIISVCRIDLSALQAGDTLIVRRYIKNTNGGAGDADYRLDSDDITYTFSGVQIIKMVDLFKDTYNTYGCKFVIVQTAGSARAFVCETITAAPGI